MTKFDIIQFDLVMVFDGKIISHGKNSCTALIVRVLAKHHISLPNVSVTLERNPLELCIVRNMRDLI